MREQNEKLTRRQRVLFAKLFAGSFLLQVPVDCEHLTEEDQMFIENSLREIGDKLIGDHPDTLGCTDSIYKYIKILK